MKYGLSSIFIVLILIFGLVGVSSQSVYQAESALSDPQISPGEYSRYRVSGEDSIEYFQMRVELDDTFEAYVVTASEPESEKILTVSRNNMVPETVVAKRLVNGYWYHTETAIAGEPQYPNPVVYIADSEDLRVLLRGYPFESKPTLEVRILGQEIREDEQFSLEVHFRKTEQIRIDGVAYEAHKLELVTKLRGMLSVFSAAAPKTFFWFATDGSHRLLRFEGSAAAFGSSRSITTELVEYRGE